MKKAGIALLAFGTAAVSFAHAAGEDDWNELGIETKHGSHSASEAVGKAEALDEKFERAKRYVSEALGAPKEADPRVSASAPPPKPISRELIQLKNGQVLTDAKIVETDKKGYWVELEGARLFLEKTEVAEIKKQ